MRGKLSHKLKKRVVFLEAFNGGGDRARLITYWARFSHSHKHSRQKKTLQATLAERMTTRENSRALVAVIERIIADGALQPLELLLHETLSQS